MFDGAASQNGEAANQQVELLKQQNRQLQQENQLLKFKLDVLVDMVRQIYLKRLLTYCGVAIDDKVGFAHERGGDSKDWQILTRLDMQQ